MRSRCIKLSMVDDIASVLTTLSRSPVRRHTAFYHVTLFLLIHGLRHASVGLRIYNCQNNKVEIFEDSPAPVTCGDITSRADVYWLRGDGVNIGECSTDGTCTTALYNDYRLSRSPQSTESQLTLVPDYRRHAGLTVTCQDRYSLSTATCTLVIRHHSELSECQVTNNTVDWTVSGSCRVQQAFSSDNIYTCTWTRNIRETFGGFDASRELCSFTQALPQAGGLYTYSISLSPPATTTFSRELRLVEPGDLTTTCPELVVSGRDLSCTCQTTNTASPPATVRWEGRDSEKLVKTNVQREDNGTQFTCHVTWAGRLYTSISYILIVEYVEGPTDVVINEAHQSGINSSQVVTLSCTTTGAVYPGVNFTWSTGVCQNETHTARSSTCTVIVDAEDDGKSVTCTAINSIDSRISVSTSVTLRINDLSSVTSPTRVIIGVVVAVVGIAVIAAVAVILILQRRRRLQKTPADSVQLPLGSNEIVTDLHVDETQPTNNDGYTNLSIREVSATVRPTDASESKDQSDMYENTQRLPDQTYDTTCRPYEEHKYSDLKVMTTQGQSKVKVTTQDLRDGEERDRDIYYNVS